MNCDDVFDILTRGPFPTGDPSDLDVESHLARCQACYRFAQALRPAVDLFEEAAPASECRDLPGYWGELATALSEDDARTAAVGTSRRTKMQRAARIPWRVHERVRQGKRWIVAHAGSLAVCAAAIVMLVATLGMLSWDAASRRTASTTEGGRLQIGSRSEAGIAPSAGSSFVQRSGRLAALRLAEACFIPGSPSRQDLPYEDRVTLLLLAAETFGENCCTECHHRQATQIPTAATARVARSCSICHL